MSFKKKVIHTFYTRSFLQVFSIINSIIYARILGPSGYGAALMLVIFPPIIVKFINLGVASSLTYHVNKNPSAKDSYIGTALIFAFIVAIFSTALLLFSHQLITDLYYSQIPYSHLFQMIIWFTPLYTMQLYFKSIMKSLNLIELINYISTILPTILTFVLTVITIGILKKGVTAVIYIHLTTLSVVVFAMAAVLIKRKALSLTFNRDKLIEMLSFGARGFFANFAPTLNDKMDKLVIGLFLSPDQIGIYSIAVNISSKLKIIPRSIGLPIYPEIARSTREQANALIRRLITKLFFVIVPLVIIIIIISPMIITALYGESYSPAYIPLVFLSMEVLFFSFNKILGYYYVGTGRPGTRSILKLTLLTLNCLFMFLLIPQYGITGCGIALLLSSIFVFTGSYLLFHSTKY